MARALFRSVVGDRGVEALALDIERRLIATPEPVPKQAPGVPV